MKILIGGIIIALLCTGVRFVNKLSSMVNEHDDILNSND